MNVIKQQFFLALLIPSYIAGMQENKAVPTSHGFTFYYDPTTSSHEGVSSSNTEEHFLEVPLQRTHSDFLSAEPMQNHGESKTTAPLVVKEEHDIVFYKPTGERPDGYNEVGRIPSSDTSLKNILMLMQLKGLPYDIKQYIIRLALSSTKGLCCAYELFRPFTFWFSFALKAPLL